MSPSMFFWYTEVASTMWSFVMYVLAVIVGLILIMCYEPCEEKPTENQDIAENEDGTAAAQYRHSSCKQSDFKLSSLFAVLGLNFEPESNEGENFVSFAEHFICFEEVSSACLKAGLEHTNMIIGVDFTASNEWQGRKSFNQNCLHKTSGNKVYNPYQKVIWILAQTLAPFADEDLIPVYGFGDSETTDEEVFPFKEDELPCHGFQEVLDHYNEIIKGITLSGPTSFAPIIAKAIEIVKLTKKYHILVIIADGQVNEEKPTIDAIVEASKHPLSLVVVGVGDGPWDVMEEFDHRLPKRKFDNFRFVDYHKATFKAKNPDASFALQALMEIPDQYKCIKALGYLGGMVTMGSNASTPQHSPSKVKYSSNHGSPISHGYSMGSPRHRGLSNIATNY